MSEEEVAELFQSYEDEKGTISCLCMFSAINSMLAIASSSYTKQNTPLYPHPSMIFFSFCIILFVGPLLSIPPP